MLLFDILHNFSIGINNTFIEKRKSLNFMQTLVFNHEKHQDNIPETTS